MRALLPVLLLATPAVAQTPPRLFPDRDVTVVYALSGDAASAIPGGVPGNLQVAWNAGGQRLRVQPEDGTLFLLVDLGARSVKLVDGGMHAVMSLPVRSSDLQPLTLEGAHLTRGGQETVAGLACTDYAVQSSRGHGTVCETQDGVALRAAGELNGKQGGFTAISVTYAAVPEAMFQVPRGYMKIEIPGAGRNR